MTSNEPRAARGWRLLLGATAVVAAAGLGSWYLIRPSGPSKTQGGASECTAFKTPRIGAGPGEQVEYQLRYDAAVCSGSECTALLALTGTLTAEHLKTRAGTDQVVRVQVAASLASPKDATRADPALVSSEALATPALVSFSADGSIQAIGYERQVDSPTARLLESVLRDTQVRVPACWDDEREWRATESLATATVLSHYRWNEKAREVRWTRERVLLWKDSEGLFPFRSRSAETAGSGHMARLSEEGSVQELTGRDEFVLVRAAGKTGDMRLRTSIELKPARVTHVAVKEPPPVPKGQAPGFSEPSERSSYADTARIAGHDLKSIVQELKRRATVDTEEGPSRSRLYVAATALFRRDPKAAKQAADLVRSGHDESEFLLAALGQGGTLETARMVADIMKQASVPEERHAALRALGRATVVDDAIVDDMVEQFDDPDVGGVARLMTGSVAHNAEQSSPGPSEKAVDALMDDYGTQPDVLARADSLRGLGNAGSPLALTVARHAAQSKNPLERAAAAQALRRIPSDAADRLLAGLVDDPDPLVRRSALDAALYRDPTELLLPSVDRVARLDTDNTVRREAIRVLVRWKDEVMPARTTLAWVSRNDPEQDLQRVAAEGLERFSNRRRTGP